MFAPGGDGKKAANMSHRSAPRVNQYKLVLLGVFPLAHGCDGLQWMRRDQQLLHAEGSYVPSHATPITLLPPQSIPQANPPWASPAWCFASSRASFTSTRRAQLEVRAHLAFSSRMRKLPCLLTPHRSICQARIRSLVRGSIASGSAQVALLRSPSYSNQASMRSIVRQAVLYSIRASIPGHTPNANARSLHPSPPALGTRARCSCLPDADGDGGRPHDQV